MDLRLSFMSANYVAREVGYAMTRGWGEGDRATNERFRPEETFRARFAQIAGDVRALGFDATRGARFLASAGIDMAGRWKALLARLESDLATPESAQAACATAVALFAGLEVWLDGLVPEAV